MSTQIERENMCRFTAQLAEIAPSICSGYPPHTFHNEKVVKDTPVSLNSVRVFDLAEKSPYVEA